MSGVFDPELPVNSPLTAVNVSLPRSGLGSQFVQRAKASAFHTLPYQRTQLVLGHIQPTAMLRHVAELQAAYQRSGRGRIEGFVKRPACPCSSCRRPGSLSPPSHRAPAAGRRPREPSRPSSAAAVPSPAANRPKVRKTETDSPARSYSIRFG